MTSTTFTDLPSELRNHIYNLASCVKSFQCCLCLRSRNGCTVDSTEAIDLQDGKDVTSRLVGLVALPPYECCARDHNNDGFIPCLELTMQVGAYFWVNRRSDLAREGARQISSATKKKQHNTGNPEPDKYGPNGASAGQAKGDQPKVSESIDEVKDGRTVKTIKAQRVRSEALCKGKCKAWDHAEHHTADVSQPFITKISKQVRADTLPMHYGTHHFVFTFFDRTVDGDAAIRWVDTIGKANARLLRDLVIVYRAKQDMHHIQKTVVPQLQEKGVRVDDGVVRVKRLEYPFCYCETCTMRIAGAFDHWKELGASKV